MPHGTDAGGDCEKSPTVQSTTTNSFALNAWVVRVRLHVVSRRAISTQALSHHEAILVSGGIIYNSLAGNETASGKRAGSRMGAEKTTIILIVLLRRMIAAGRRRIGYPLICNLFFSFYQHLL